jgi:CRP-like cAMP-binding protein
MFEPVLDFLRLFIPISPILEERLASYLFAKTFSRDYTLLEQGQISNYVYFIRKGFLRAYKPMEDKEADIWYMMRGDVVFSPHSFLGREPSLECIVALEETEVIGLSHEHLEMLYAEFPEFDRLGRLLISKYYAFMHKRVLSLVGTTYEERYQYLLENHPELIQKVSVTNLASYMDMSLASIKRVRSNL